MNPLSTAFKCTVETPERGFNVVIEEIKTVQVDPNNKQQIIILDEVPSTPKRHVIWLAQAHPEYLQKVLLNSLTDELIFFQWFNVKVPKKKEKK